MFNYAQDPLKYVSSDGRIVLSETTQSRESNNTPRSDHSHETIRDMALAAVEHITLEQGFDGLAAQNRK